MPSPPKSGSGRLRLRALCLVGLLVLAGCSLGPSVSPSAPGLEDGNGDGDDRLGREAGYNATDELSVTTDDGLNESERESVVARTMARVERVRQREFRERVPVRVVSRETFRDNRGGGNDSAAVRARDDQLWEATFAVDESTSSAAAFETVYGASVLGFYADGEIVIVSESETPRIDTRTLAHELVHALQAQHDDLGFGPSRHTRDGDLARQGLTEGDANYVQDRYDARCGAEWSCLSTPNRSARERPEEFNDGIYMTLVQPYVTGPAFVAALHDRGGWTAVDDAYGAVPETTAAVIRPERYGTERGGGGVEVPDRSSSAWSRFDVEHPTDRFGEAGTYVALYQGGAIGDDHARYNYSHPYTAGWVGDRIVPYHDGDGDGGNADRYGYVWRTEWETERDAREFLEGYRALLAAHNATRDGNVYVIPSGGFADAFRVTRDGTTVTVVNAPTAEALGGIHAPAAVADTGAAVEADGPSAGGTGPARPDRRRADATAGSRSPGLR